MSARFRRDRLVVAIDWQLINNSKNVSHLHRTFEVSKDAEQLVVGMLQADPDKRSTAAQVREKIQAMIDSHCDVRLDRAVPDYVQMPATPSTSADLTDSPTMLTKRWEIVSTTRNQPRKCVSSSQ